MFPKAKLTVILVLDALPALIGRNPVQSLSPALGQQPEPAGTHNAIDDGLRDRRPHVGPI